MPSNRSHHIEDENWRHELIGSVFAFRLLNWMINVLSIVVVGDFVAHALGAYRGKNIFWVVCVVIPLILITIATIRQLRRPPALREVAWTKRIDLTLDSVRAFRWSAWIRRELRELTWRSAIRQVAVFALCSGAIGAMVWLAWRSIIGGYIAFYPLPMLMAMSGLIVVCVVYCAVVASGRLSVIVAMVARAILTHDHSGSADG